MTPPLPLLHHVVFAIGCERLDAATDYLTALGFRFPAFELESLFGIPLTLMATNMPDYHSPAV